MERIPKLTNVFSMTIIQVHTWICIIPYSFYYGQPRKIVSEQLDYNEAHRYLAELIVLNEQFKSNLDYVSEMNSVDEQSRF